MKVMIIGGVAGGASAAARLRRLNDSAEIVMVERGPHISFANCGLPYHVGGVIEDEDDLLLQTPESFKERFHVEVRVRTEALSIDPAAKTLALRDLETGRDYSEPYDYLVLAPGAEPIRPPLPGLDHPKVLTLRNIPDMEKILGAAKGAKRAVVIGAGYIGIEVAENLAHKGLQVEIAELADHVLGPMDTEMSALLNPAITAHGVGLHLSDGIAAVREQGDGIVAVLQSGTELPADFAVLGIGVRPETGLAKAAGLAIGTSGAIAVDARMQTSDPAIFAVGDAVEVVDLVSGKPTRVPLAGPANRQGRIAADNICGRDSRYRGTLGASVLKVFDFTAALCGNNERQLKADGVNYEKVYIHAGSHAGYYPGARQVSLKLLFDKETGKIYGAQAVGMEGVEKRIDVIATAMQGGLTVEDLEHLELCYAPPYSSAKDPVNLAGFVASNHRRGDMPILHWHEFAGRDPQSTYLVDVRTRSEYAAGTIGDAVNIPVDELRERMNELPKDRELWVICQVGLRGHVATRMLLQNGFRARNLSGGYKTWRAATTTLTAPQSEPPLLSGADDPVNKDDDGEDHTADQAVTADKVVDATGLQCPGPIMSTFQALEGMTEGQVVQVLATEPGFAADIGSWCRRTGNTLIRNEYKDGAFAATIRKGGVPCSEPASMLETSHDKTMVVFSSDLDKALASFIIANGAAAMGRKVTMFFTFWGLNILRKPKRVLVKKDFMATMFGQMMPRGTGKLGLSRMNMAGMGPALIRSRMAKKSVTALEDLIQQALRNGVRLVACSMSMDVMGLNKEEFIDGVEVAGVASYLAAAEEADTNLFI